MIDVALLPARRGRPGSSASTVSASASSTSGTVDRSSRPRTNSADAGVAPQAGPAGDDVLAKLEDTVESRGRDAAVSASASGSVMYSGAIDATIAQARRGRRDGHEAGARLQRAHRGEVRRARLPPRSRHERDAAEVPLVRVGGTRLDELTHLLGRQQLDVRAVEPVDAPRAGSRCRQSPRRPACASPGGSTSGSFGAASVTVIEASMQSPSRCGVSADRPLGRSIETIGMPDALTSATTVSIIPPSGDFRPVPKMASTISVHCEISEKCSSHACSSSISTTVTPSRPRMSRLVRASPRTSASAADDEDRGVDAALEQRPRDDEAVAAVVAAAAEHRDPPVEPRLVRRLHGRDDLAARRSPSAPATGSRCLRW